MHESSQIISNINMGLIVLDRNLVVKAWNFWMEHHSGISEKTIEGRIITELYPNLSDPKYRRFFNSVFRFGNFAYFSQKLHRFLFSMKNPHSSAPLLPQMQQSCTAGPIRDRGGTITSIFIAVQDVTENVAAELVLKEKVRQLEEALSTVKMLQGIIPICMYCKKIRNDQESWQQMERYITEHSAAHFSHSICPECLTSEQWLKNE